MFEKGYSYTIDPDFDKVDEPLDPRQHTNTLTQQNTYVPISSIPMNYGERAINASAYT